MERRGSDGERPSETTNARTGKHEPRTHVEDSKASSRVNLGVDDDGQPVRDDELFFDEGAVAPIGLEPPPAPTSRTRWHEVRFAGAKPRQKVTAPPLLRDLRLAPTADDDFAMTTPYRIDSSGDAQRINAELLRSKQQDQSAPIASGIRRPIEGLDEDHTARSEVPLGRLAPQARSRSDAVRELIREGDVLLGKYRVECVTNENLVVTATVTHIDLRRQARLTLLSPHGHGFATAREQFTRAIKALTQMQSEYVCRIVDAGVLGSSGPFQISDLAGEIDLAEYLSDRGPLPITEAVDFTIQAAEALADAHTFGICHGSLTPANIRIASGVDGSPVVRLLGFGVMAQWILGGKFEGSRTKPRARSPDIDPIQYLSPEQIRHPDQVDSRTDIWGLGVILHEMLAGAPAFRAETRTATLAAIAADSPQILSSLRSDIPRQLESTVLRCMHKDRHARFPSIAEVVLALAPHASADAQNVAERIVRIVARGNTRSFGLHRSPTALVHVGPASSHARATNETQVPRNAAPAQLGLGWFAATLLGVGLFAGITGAIVAARWMPPARANTAAPVQAVRNNPEPATAQMSYAATPIATLAVASTPSAVPRPTELAEGPIRRISAPVRRRPKPSTSSDGGDNPARESGRAAPVTLTRGEPAAPRARKIQGDAEHLFDDIK